MKTMNGHIRNLRLPGFSCKNNPLKWQGVGVPILSGTYYPVEKAEEEKE